MRKVLKWIGIVFGVLVGLVLVGLAVLYVLTDARLNQRFTVPAEYGHYLAGVCTFCHGPNYAGSSGPHGAANLTPAGDLAHWTEADFLNTLRTGRTPDGKVLKPDEMPWTSVGQMTDDELEAVWLFLKTLAPAQPAQH